MWKFLFCLGLIQVALSAVMVCPPGGWYPSTVKKFYNMSTSPTAGAGRKLAVVMFYDDPYAEADLNTFSAKFSLPNCTTQNGCFQKVNQTGGSSFTGYPQASGETSLDIQWAHAIAPGAKIVLVLAKSNYWSDVSIALAYAATIADYVSYSAAWGDIQRSDPVNYAWQRPGVTLFVPSGDTGATVLSSDYAQNIIVVGGTQFQSNVYNVVQFIAEVGWSASSGGCSAFLAPTTPQANSADAKKAGCGNKRAVPDVAMIAYCLPKYCTLCGGWSTSSGTSAAAPIFAARAVVSGLHITQSTIYSTNSPIKFRDIVNGTATGNGRSLSCTPGFDLVTGRGSWIGQ